MSGYLLRSARWLARDVMERHLFPGARVIDATMGNGHDTLYLCGLVGETGRVVAFDVQTQAVENTEKLLLENGMKDRAELHLCGHEKMALYVKEPVDAVMFNLGWLPGGDKSVTTHWETTRVAMDAALKLLGKNGVCVVCAYPGHAAGAEELERIREYFSSLRPQEFNVLEQNFLNAGPGAPVCFVAQRQ